MQQCREEMWFLLYVKLKKTLGTFSTSLVGVAPLPLHPLLHHPELLLHFLFLLAHHHHLQLTLEDSFPSSMVQGNVQLSYYSPFSLLSFQPQNLFRTDCEEPLLQKSQISNANLPFLGVFLLYEMCSVALWSKCKTRQMFRPNAYFQRIAKRYGRKEFRGGLWRLSRLKCIGIWYVFCGLFLDCGESQTRELFLP